MGFRKNRGDFSKTFTKKRKDTIQPIGIRSSDPHILSFPWECLYHQELGFLGRNPNFTFFRQLRSVESSPPPVSYGPLKVLLFCSLPDDLSPETQRLDIETEQDTALFYQSKGKILIVLDNLEAIESTQTGEILNPQIQALITTAN